MEEGGQRQALSVRGPCTFGDLERVNRFWKRETGQDRTGQGRTGQDRTRPRKEKKTKRKVCAVSGRDILVSEWVSE